MKLKSILAALLFTGAFLFSSVNSQAQQLNIGSTIVVIIGTQSYTFQVTPPPLVVNAPFPVNTTITSVYETLNLNMTANGGTGVPGFGYTSFGFTGNFGLVSIPFDGGLTLLLGAGAVAGVRRMRKSKKQGTANAIVA